MNSFRDNYAKLSLQIDQTRMERKRETELKATLNSIREIGKSFAFYI